MMHTLAPWLSALVAASLKGSIILVAGLLAARAMRRSSAEARHAILAIALVAFLAVPAATLLTPAWTVIPLPAMPTELVSAIDRVGGDDRLADGGPHDAASTRRTASRDEASGSAAGPLAGHVGRSNGASPSGGPTTSTPQRPDGGAVPAAGDVASAASTVRTPTASEALLLAWLLGASLIGLRLLLGLARLRILSRHATMVTDGAWLHTAHAIARRLGLTRGITLLRGDRDAVPMTWGVLSPVVWLPPAADRWPVELRMSVLSHELAHVRRRDAVMQWIANLAVVVHWFNPLVWVATRTLRAERERACDDAVLALGAAPDDYAGHLLDMVRALGGRGGPAPAMAMARRSQFEGRLLAILDRASPRGPVSGGRLVVAGLGAATLVLAVGGLRTTEAARVSAAREQPPIAAPAPTASRTQAASDSVRSVPTSAPRRPAAEPMSAVAPTGRPASVAPDARVGSGVQGRVDTPAQAPEPERRRPLAGTSVAPEASTASHGDEPDARPAPESPLTPVLDPPTLAPPPSAVPATSSSAVVSALSSVRGQGSALSRNDTALLLDVIAAAEGISSSSDRVAVLERVANLSDLAPGVVTALGKAAGRVQSSTSRTKLLRTLVRRQPHAVGTSRRSVLDALSQEVTSTDFAAVLEDFIKRDSITEPALADAFTAAAKITSNTEKTRVLVLAARLRKPEGAARAAYLKAAASISTGSDRARALSALFEDPPVEREGAQR